MIVLNPHCVVCGIEVSTDFVVVNGTVRCMECYINKILELLKERKNANRQDRAAE